MKHVNTAVFVPHIGCPHACSFCDQRQITGETAPPSKEDVIAAAKTAIASKNHNPQRSEIAFFGGSFTAINAAYRDMLLQAAYPFVQSGQFRGIRISTRPDAIDRDMLSHLRAFGVSAIELGAQSMDDTVLQKNRRGHSAADVAASSKMIRENGFELGLQMMTGLYGDTPEISVQTAKRIAALKPAAVRIYPALVLKDTHLASLYKRGMYMPQTLDESVELCSILLKLFEKQGIKVIRLGLHDTVSLKESLVAGPYHPAFRELCESRLFFEQALAQLQKQDVKNVVLRVNPKDVSKMTGHKKRNLHKLFDLGYCCKVVSDDTINSNHVKTERC